MYSERTHAVEATTWRCIRVLPTNERATNERTMWNERASVRPPPCRHAYRYLFILPPCHLTSKLAHRNATSKSRDYTIDNPHITVTGNTILFLARREFYFLLVEPFHPVKHSNAPPRCRLHTPDFSPAPSHSGDPRKAKIQLHLQA